MFWSCCSVRIGGSPSSSSKDAGDAPKPAAKCGSGVATSQAASVVAAADTAEGGAAKHCLGDPTVVGGSGGAAPLGQSALNGGVADPPANGVSNGAKPPPMPGPRSGGGESQANMQAPVPPLKKQPSDVDRCETGSTAKTSARSAGGCSASSLGSEFISEQIPAHRREVARIQSQMKIFVKGMVRGRDMSVLSVDGQLRACTCSFDRKLRNYNIVINRETRSIALSKFREVFQGTEPEDIATPLDELCATFVLENGECLTFRFRDIEEREHFAMCLQIIVDGHQ